MFIGDGEGGWGGGREGGRKREGAVAGVNPEDHDAVDRRQNNKN